MHVTIVRKRSYSYSRDTFLYESFQKNTYGERNKNQTLSAIDENRNKYLPRRAYNLGRSTR